MKNYLSKLITQSLLLFVIIFSSSASLNSYAAAKKDPIPDCTSLQASTCSAAAINSCNSEASQEEAKAQKAQSGGHASNKVGKNIAATTNSASQTTTSSTTTSNGLGGISASSKAAGAQSSACQKHAQHAVDGYTDIINVIAAANSACSTVNSSNTQSNLSTAQKTLKDCGKDVAGNAQVAAAADKNQANPNALATTPPPPAASDNNNNSTPQMPMASPSSPSSPTPTPASPTASTPPTTPSTPAAPLSLPQTPTNPNPLVPSGTNTCSLPTTDTNYTQMQSLLSQIMKQPGAEQNASTGIPDCNGAIQASTATTGTLASHNGQQAINTTECGSLLDELIPIVDSVQGQLSTSGNNCGTAYNPATNATYTPSAGAPAAASTTDGTNVSATTGANTP